MKKIIIISIAAMAAMLSCTKAELQQQSENSNNTVTVTFTTDATKLAIGELNGNKYPVTWEEGDTLAICNATTDIPVYIGKATLISGAGTSTATFQAQVTSELCPEGTPVQLFVGPSGIKAEQVAKTAGNNNPGNLTYVVSQVLNMSYSTPMSFKLSPSEGIAIIKVDVSSTDFKDLALQKVMIYRKGAVNFNEDETDYCQVTFTEPATLSEKRSAYLSAYSFDTATNYYVVATLYGKYNGVDGTTVTIPVEFKDKTLKGGKVNHIKLENLTLASNSCADWYEPVETRYLAGGWAYGDANTHYVQFEGTTASSKGNITVNAKARGAFNKVEKPVKAKVLMSSNISSSSWAQVNGSALNEYPITDVAAIPVRGNLADASAKGCIGQWAIYGESGKIIWTFNLWMGIDTPGTVTLDNGTIQDRNLGASFKREGNDNWKANGVYFQWGRFSFNDWGNAYYSIVDSDVKDIQTAIEKAPKIILNTYFEGKLNNDGDWYLKEHKDDFWGATSRGSSVVGTKSVYDPCPKGYKVMSRPIVEELCTAIQNGTAEVVSTTTYYYISYKGTSFPLAGGFNAAADKAVSRFSSNSVKTAWYWADSAYSNKDATCLYFDISKLSNYKTGTNIQKNRPRSCSYSVRCMVDTANR